MRNLQKKLIRSTKYHSIIGLALGLWIFIFLVSVGPFDAGPISMKYRFLLMPGYGLIFFLSYLLMIPLQEKLVQKALIRRKPVTMEFFVATAFFILCLFLSFSYYQSSFVLGEYPFLRYLVEIYIPVFVIIWPIAIGLRYLVKQKLKKTTDLLVLGNKKYDKIRIRFSNLVFVKAADNYVEVHYLENETLKQKLIRSTLKEIKQKVPELIQTHRSYLINKSHVVRWDNKKTLCLTQAEIPVSETYRQKINFEG